MKLKRQTSTTATPTYPATLEYGDLAVANNGVPAFGDKDNLPVPLGTAAEIKQINSSLGVVNSISVQGNTQPNVIYTLTGMLTLPPGLYLVLLHLSNIEIDNLNFMRIILTQSGSEVTTTYNHNGNNIIQIFDMSKTTVNFEVFAQVNTKKAIEITYNGTLNYLTAIRIK